jgi:hypothetical protein
MRPYKVNEGREEEVEIMNLSIGLKLWFLYFKYMSFLLFALSGVVVVQGQGVWVFLLLWIVAALHFGFAQILSVKYRIVPVFFRWMPYKFQIWFNKKREEEELLERGETYGLGK